MTPARRERANRIAAGYSVGMLLCAVVFGVHAWQWASWQAVGFALMSVMAVLSVAVSVLLLWVATSVDAVDPVGGESNV